MDFGGSTPQENVLNMHEIMFSRKCAMEASGVDIVYTDSLYKGDFDTFYKDTQTLVNIDYDAARKIYMQWHNCHWDWADTKKWKYYANRSNI